VKHRIADIVGCLLIAAVFLAIGHAGQQKTPAAAPSTPVISEATKIKLLLAQHDLEQTQVRFAQLQQQFQQQQTQISAEAGKEFQALEYLKEMAYAEAKADKSAWTLTDKMEFVPVRRPNAPGIAGPGTPPIPATAKP
jgi:hypothetical protein